MPKIWHHGLKAEAEVAAESVIHWLAVGWSDTPPPAEANAQVSASTDVVNSKKTTESGS